MEFVLELVMLQLSKLLPIYVICQGFLIERKKKILQADFKFTNMADIDSGITCFLWGDFVFIFMIFDKSCRNSLNLWGLVNTEEPCYEELGHNKSKVILLVPAPYTTVFLP